MLKTLNTIIGSVVNLVKNLRAPLRANGARFGISKMPKTIESKINKNQLFTTQTFRNLSECIQFRMHISSSITQTQGTGMSLKNILTHRNNLALVQNQRNVLLLSLHSHRKRLGDGEVNLVNRVYIQFNPSSTSASTLPCYPPTSSKEQRCPCSNLRHTET